MIETLSILQADALSRAPRAGRAEPRTTPFLRRAWRKLSARLAKAPAATAALAVAPASAPCCPAGCCA